MSIRAKITFVLQNLLYSAGRSPISVGHLPPPEHQVPSDFFGICVASAPDPECDDYILHQLSQLNIHHVRLDVSYSDEYSYTERFLKRLISEKFKVCLHPVQPFEEAGNMNKKDQQDRWRNFISSILDSYGHDIAIMEIGSTCNRCKWTGYNIDTFLTAWKEAYDEASSRNIIIAGPNVTDFEPIYNIGLLGLLKSSARLPSIHSDNLFVERATEPETFDHKICGRIIAPAIKYNLIKKARTLQNISSYYGISQTICSHTAWSMRRINRILPNVEQKQADYLARYCCLAAASGALTRLYWGPMIGQREGLIDDGTHEYPQIPHVTFYGKANGNIANYRERPAFQAYRTTKAFLAGSTYKRHLASAKDLEIHEFETTDKLIHVAWTTNGNCAALPECYDTNDLNSSSVFTRDGTLLDHWPPLISESPIYLTWPINTKPSFKTGADILHGIRFSHQHNDFFHPVRNDKWNGICTSDTITSTEQSVFMPEALEKYGNKQMLRRARNLVWSMPDPRDLSSQLVVKRHKIKRFHKTLLQFLKPSKAVRSWNGAHELSRRGISTPKPVAFFQQNSRTSVSDNYFVYRFFDQPYSARSAFYAFRDGKTSYQNIPQTVFYEKLSSFLNNMHNRGVYYKDLSAGNVLFGIGNNLEPEFTLIDTGRAIFYKHGVQMLERLADLKRICHPLDWTGRNIFMNAYLTKTNHKFEWWMKASFWAYDWKHKIKQSIKRILKSKKNHL